MAQITIDSTTSTGLFSTNGASLKLINGNAQSVDIVTDANGCKDSIIALVDIPDGTENENIFTFKSCEANNDIKIKLINGKLNVIRFTTKGFKKPDGTVEFTLTTDNGIGFDAVSPKITFVKCVDAVNR